MFLEAKKAKSLYYSGIWWKRKHIYLLFLFVYVIKYGFSGFMALQEHADKIIMLVEMMMMG